MSRTSKIIALTIGNGVNLILGFLLVPYLARALSLQDYGTYGQVLMVVGFFATFLGLGLDKVLYADLSDEDYDQAQTVKSNFALVASIGLLGTFALAVSHGYLASYFNNQQLDLLILLYALSIPFHLLYTAINSTLIYFNRVQRSVQINVSTNLLRLLLTLFFVQVYYSLECIFIALTLVPIIQSALAYFSLPKEIRNSGHVEMTTMSRQLKLGLPLGLTVIIGTILTATDGFMVSRMLDVESYALFRNGAIYIPVLVSIYGAVNTIILPDITKFYAKGRLEEIATLKRRSLTNSAALVYPIVVFCILFSEEIIVFLLSEKYLQSHLVFAIFNGILFFRVGSYSDIYIAARKNNLLPAPYLFAAVFNILANYLFIKYWGIAGAAAASLLSFALLVVLLLKGGVRILNMRIGNLVDYRRIVHLFLFPSIVAAFFFGLHRQLQMDFLTIVFFGLFMITCYYFILRFEYLEKVLVRRLIDNNKITKPLLKYFDLLYPEGVV